MAGKFSQPFLEKGAVLIVLNDHILGNGVLQDESAFLPVLGNCGYLVVQYATGGKAQDLIAVNGDASRFRFYQSGQSIDKFVLSITVDTGNPYDLTFFLHSG